MTTDERGRWQPGRSVAYRMSLWILLLSFLIALLGAGFHLYLAYNRSLDEISSNIDSAHNSTGRILLQSLWLMNEELVTGVMEGILSVPFVVRVEVYQDDGTLLTVGRGQPVRELVHEHNLTREYRGETIILGRIRIIANLDLVYGRLARDFIGEIITFGLWAILLGLAVMILFQRQVGRHLRSMSDFASTLSVKTLDRPLILEKAARPESALDEIEVLSFAINDMRIKLQASLQTMREQETQLSAIMGNTDDHVIRFDQNRTLTFANPAARKAYGLEDDCTGLAVQSLPLPLSIRKQWESAIEEAFSAGETRSLSYLIRVNGSDEYRELKLTPEEGAAGNVESVIGFARDLTQRIESEEKLQWELGLSRAVTEISEKLLSPDATMETIAGITLKHAMEFSNSPHGFISFIDPKTLENVCYHHTGIFLPELADNDQRISFAADKNGDYPGLWGHALNSGEAFFTNFPKRHPYYAKPASGNRDPASFLAAPACVGEQVVGIVALSDTEGGYRDKDLRMAKRLAETYAIALLRDKYETDSQIMHRELVQSQKMESVGTLAGGIAHDFNNILSSIIGFTELALDDTPKGSDQEDSLLEIYAAGKRAADLVKQILTFSRHDESEVKPLQISTIVKEALKMLRSTIPTSIEIRENIDTDPIVNADATQLHQVVVNLAANARHAMAEGVGVLEIGVDTMLVEEGIQPGQPDISPGNYARITVSDSGIGIPEKDIDKIFEPYFTSKEKGEGTGLGLSVVHGIVKSHGGYITVHSESGRGTTFRVYLPMLKRVAPDLQESEVEQLSTGSERILLVDDEPSIVKMQRRNLERLGYTVTPKVSSTEALETFRASPETFDLLVSDITMPYLTGDKLAAEVKTIRPDMPVILCTGYSAQIRDQWKELEIDQLLMKPVNKTTMSKAVRTALDKI